jgi:hypothetical protein
LLRRSGTQRTSKRSALFGLCRRDLTVVRTAKHFKSAEPVLVGVEVVVATRAVSAAIARRLVVHFAVASLRRAARSLAVVLRTALGRGTSETPDVVPLPCATASVAAPRASSG